MDNLPKYIKDNLNLILLDRKGDDQDASMKTIEIIGHVCDQDICRLEDGKLVKLDNIENINLKKHDEITIFEPKTLKLKNRWNHNNILNVDNSNILGSNIGFLVNDPEIHIPIVQTNNVNLSYF